ALRCCRIFQQLQCFATALRLFFGERFLRRLSTGGERPADLRPHPCVAAGESPAQVGGSAVAAVHPEGLGGGEANLVVGIAEQRSDSVGGLGPFGAPHRRGRFRANRGRAVVSCPQKRLPGGVVLRVHGADGSCALLGGRRIHVPQRQLLLLGLT